MSETTIYLRFGVISLVGAALITLVSISIDRAIVSLDSMLIPCQHGTTYSMGSCFCQGTPFAGKFCGICNCTTGTCVLGGTTPRITSDYGCRCPKGSKFFGFLCERCHTMNKTYETDENSSITGCVGDCEEGFFGRRCERTCFADVSYQDTLPIDVTGDEKICRDLRSDGGICNACSGHGTCKDGDCVCDKNYYDDGFSKCSKTCPVSSNGKLCSGNGVCKLYGNTPSCLCETGWRGTDCDVACPGIKEGARACHGHGSCLIDYSSEVVNPYCICQDKYKGDSCQIVCPGDHGQECSGHGTCVVDGNQGNCICDAGSLVWNGRGCNCTDLMTCNGRGTCIDGSCRCEANYDGKNCMNCKPNYYGSQCLFYCDASADLDTDPVNVGCHGHGVCTVFNRDTTYESVGCECDRNEVIKRIKRKKTRMYSTFSQEIFCKDCVTGYFPKMDIFNAYDTTPLGLHVPCQISCTPVTCNNEGFCNDLYGAPGEPLCICNTGENGYRHLNDTSFCTKCENNWFPDQVTSEEGCTNFCIADLMDVGGSFPAICDEGDIDCTHCNGNGICNPLGGCECDFGYTGDFCQIQCTSDSGLICGGHGVCETNDLQSLLQFELQYVEDSGALYQCTCDPQDTYTKEARERYIIEGNEGALDPPPNASYFGETCDYHCLKPPWLDSDECNDLGNCTIYSIVDPNDNTFNCFKDEDCEVTAVQRITSGDASWHGKKGPFCKKDEYPEDCEDDTYHIDDCLDILTLFRPPKSRAKQCMENTICRHLLEKYDWHQWCSNIVALNKPVEFDGCGSISQFCPSTEISSSCSGYVTLSQGISISANMDFCYEFDKKNYPFAQDRDYRLDDESSEFHDLISNEMRLFHEEFPLIDIDITPYCANHMNKFNTRITEVNTNKRFLCGSIITSKEACISASTESDTYKPFAVKCPNELDVNYHTLLEAEQNRGYNCIVHEVNRRYIMENNIQTVAYGGNCFEDIDCLIGYCHGDTCCASAENVNCKRCNNLGQCAECKLGTSWNGLICAGTPDEDDPSILSLTGLELKEGIDMIDDTCSTATNHFPRCVEPSNICDVSPCKGDDICIPNDRDGICTTRGVLDCTCNYGLQCIPLTFNTYKCIGNYSETQCPQEYKDFNWFEYCLDNNPVLKKVHFSSDILQNESPASGYTISLIGGEQHTKFIHYWVQPTTVFSSSKYIEVRETDNILARVYLHQGQIQLNGIQPLEACPLDNLRCQETWGYEPNTWYQLEIEIDYTNRKVRLHKGSEYKEDNFICTDCLLVSVITDVSIYGTTETYYDEIIFEKSIAEPSIASTCESYVYCDMNVNFRQKCSDMNRNVRYPSLLEPQGDIISTCKSFFQDQSFSQYNLGYQEERKLYTLDWDHYCLFYDSVKGDFNCWNQPYTYFEDYSLCRDKLDPLDGSMTCMNTALGYDWDDYCGSLIKAATPMDIKIACPKPCYKHFTNFDKCEDRLAMFEDNHHLKDSRCSGDWVDFCTDVTMNKHNGKCAAVECRCNYETYEGTAGQSCELHCPIASDGSPCGEESGVGSCVYTDREQEIYDRGELNDEGDWIAWQASRYEIIGECDCFLSEGKQNCDQVCLKCNETVYDEEFLSPVHEQSWRGTDIIDVKNSSFHSNSSSVISTGSIITLDLRDEHVLSGILLEGSIKKYVVSLSTDDVFYDHTSCNDEENCTVTNYKTQILYEGRCSSWRYIDPFAAEFKSGLTSVECVNICQTIGTDYTGAFNSEDECLCSKITCVGFDSIVETDDFTTFSTYMIGFSKFIIRGYARFIRVEILEENSVTGSMNMGVYITETGQIGSCNSGTGVCECLPPFTSIVEEQYTNWRGYHSKRMKRVYGLPEQYNTIDEFRIRAMQGKESFTKKYLKDKVVIETTSGYTLLPVTEEECRTYSQFMGNDVLIFDENRPGPGCSIIGLDVRYNNITCDKFTGYKSSGYTGNNNVPSEEDCGSTDDLNSGSVPYGCLRKDGQFYYNSNTAALFTSCGTDGYECVELEPTSYKCKCTSSSKCISFEEQYAYNEGDDWKLLYEDFRDQPDTYYCDSGKKCDSHDFILLGNMDGSSNRFNFDCNTHCENTDPITKIPCSGHGSCKVTGQCICDPAAYVSGTDPLTGFSMDFNIGNGETLENSDYQATKYELTGWRGTGCEKICPGYDIDKKSMLDVCGGHGICNGDAQCECSVGYTGEYCQFKCPGFQDGDENVCSGHGTCVLNTIEVTQVDEPFLLYEGRCSDWKYIDDEYVFGLSLHDCIDQCRTADYDYTGAIEYSASLSSSGAGFIDEAVDETTCRNYAANIGKTFSENSNLNFGYNSYGKWDGSVSETECEQFATQLGANYVYSVKDTIYSPGGCFQEGQWTIKAIYYNRATSSSIRTCNHNEDHRFCITKPDGCREEADKVYYHDPRAGEYYTSAGEATGSEYLSCTSDYNCVKASDACICSKLYCDTIESNKYFYNTYAMMGEGDANTLPVDCAGTWSTWSACDGERQRRAFTVYTYPKYGGEECPSSPEFNRCSFENIDCDGTWSTWSVCDGEYRNRTFTTTIYPQNNGFDCPLSPEIKLCEINPVDCDGIWSSWTNCEYGQQQRTFNITEQPSTLGLSCPESPQVINCDDSQVNCLYINNGWGECDKGIQTKTYTTLIYPSDDGVPCPKEDTRPCDGCSADEFCTTGICKGEYCCHSDIQICASCDKDGSCIDCGQNANFNMEGICKCEDGFIDNTSPMDLEFDNEGTDSYYVEPLGYDPHLTLCTNRQYTFKRISSGHPLRVVTSDECGPFCGTFFTHTFPASSVPNWEDVLGWQNKEFTFTTPGEYFYLCTSHETMIGKITVMDCPPCVATQRRLRKPLRRRLGAWSPWGICLNNTQARVRHKTVSIHISRDKNKSFVVDGLKDPHLEIDIHNVDNTHEHEQYIHTYTSKVQFKRLDEGFPVMLVRDEHCPNCSTGTWSSTPIFERIIPLIKYGKGVVEWTPLLADIGTYYLITPEHPSMVTKITVTNTSNDYYRSLEIRDCEPKHHILTHTTADVCGSDADCNNKTCLGGRCCNKNDRLCDRCNNNGYCSSCKKDTQMNDGICQPVDCNAHYGVSHLAYVHGKGCKHKLGSTLCTSDNDCGIGTNGQCIGGTCCNEYYTNVDNCLQCNDGTREWEWQYVKAPENGEVITTGGWSFSYKDATRLCAEDDNCKMISRWLSDLTWKRYDEGVNPLQETYSAYTNSHVPEQYRITEQECRTYAMETDRYASTGETIYVGTLGDEMPEYFETTVSSGRIDPAVSSADCQMYATTNNYNFNPISDVVKPVYSYQGQNGGCFRDGDTVYYNYATTYQNGAGGENKCNYPIRCIRKMPSWQVSPGVGSSIFTYVPPAGCSFVNGRLVYTLGDQDIYPPLVVYRETEGSGYYCNQQFQCVTHRAPSTTRESYVKVNKPINYCSICMQGSIWFPEKGECQPLNCPRNQQWYVNEGCRTANAGELDTKMQVPIQIALSKAYCRPGFYKDIELNECLPIMMRPKTDVTLYIDQGEISESSMIFRCEIRGATKIACPQCNCLFDFLFGKWSSFQCETCLKGFGKKQCRTMCPGYDGENQDTMCSNQGICQTGSLLSDTGDRVFKDASCMCGNPPALYNSDKTEMQQYLAKYTEIGSISYDLTKVTCIANDVMHDGSFDNCYHFNINDADCSTCETGFSGKNCQYKCDKCLDDGTCDGVPSHQETGACVCKAVDGVLPDVWNYNCCPIGFRVTDLNGFNALDQSWINDYISTAEGYSSTRFEDTTYEDADPMETMDDTVTEAMCSQYASDRQITYSETVGGCYISATGCRGLYIGGYVVGQRPDTITYQAPSLCQNLPANEQKCNYDVSNDGNTIYTCIKFRAGKTGEAARRDAAYWCRPCPGVGDDMWLTTNAIKSICGGQRRGTCYRKDATQNACNCIEGNGGTGLPEDDWVGQSCMCNANYWVPYVNLGTQYGCNGLGTCLNEVIKVGNVDIACSPQAGYYLKVEYDPQTQSSSTEVTPAAAGQHVPDNGDLFLRDGTGDHCAYGEDFNGILCLNCNNGYYQDQAGQATCKACPAGQYTDKWTVSGVTSCKTCPIGKISVRDADGLSAASRPAGSDKANNCIQCPVGRYAGSAGLGICQKCPSGKYNNNVMSELDNYPYVDDSGSCKDCTKGKYQMASNNFPDPGEYGDNDILEYGYCLKCPHGYEGTDVGQEGFACSFCPGGKVAFYEGTDECSSCPAGKYKASSEYLAINAPGTKDTVPECNSGFIYEDTNWLNMGGNGFPCSADYNNKYCCVESDDFLGPTYLCAAKWHPYSGSPVPMGYQWETIPGGTDYYGARNEPDSCYFLPTTCDQCNNGYYSVAGSSYCDVCPKGYYCPDTATKTACPAGTYNDQTAHTAIAAACKECPQGKYASGTANTASSDCLSCTGTTGNSGSGNTGCNLCAGCHPYGDWGTCTDNCGNACGVYGEQYRNPPTGCASYCTVTSQSCYTCNCNRGYTDCSNHGCAWADANYWNNHGHNSAGRFACYERCGGSLCCNGCNCDLLGCWGSQCEVCHEDGCRL